MNTILGNSFGKFTQARFAVLVFFGTALALLSSPGARAGCGEAYRPPAGLVLSWLHHQGHDDFRPNGPATIVGLWHVKYTAADGSPFLESFKTWHDDRTEFENAFLPPIGGNICFGVWKEVGRLTVKLHHVGLMFNPDGSIKATFTVDEVDTVAVDDKTYKGTFDFRVFDPAGNLLQEVKGTTAATRITVD